MHASLYKWTADILPAIEYNDVCSFLSEPAWLRKESLYKAHVLTFFFLTFQNAISLLDQAKDWEVAIDLIQEQIDYSETILYDYKKVASLLVGC